MTFSLPSFTSFLLTAGNGGAADGFAAAAEPGLPEPAAAEAAACDAGMIGTGAADTNEGAGTIGAGAVGGGAKAAGKSGDISFLNDRSAGIIGAAAGARGLVNSLGLTGRGQIIGIADSGLDSGRMDDLHPDLQSEPGRMPRVAFLRSWTDRAVSDDPLGHGTHMAATLVGSGAASGGQFQGIAPGASLYFQALLDSKGQISPPSDLNSLFYPAYAAGVRIHVDGWGGGSNAYGSEAAQIDAFVRRYPDFLPVFGAGNSGPAKSSLTAEANSKNALVVGASQSPRPAFGDQCQDAETLASFSSRGPAGDGRIKPDLTVPGSAVISACSRLTESNFAANPAYTRLGGTSMSAAVAGGALALLREYLTSEMHLAAPSAALMKAALINGASSVKTASGREESPFAAGFGELDLAQTLLALEEGSFRLEDSREGLAASEICTYTFTVSGSGAPVKVTLAWTDPAAPAGSSSALVNDLDLIVESPDGKKWAGNHFLGATPDSPDRINNVEQVCIQQAVPGLYRVTVKAAKVAQPGVGGAALSGSLRQDFALVYGQTLPSGVFREMSVSAAAAGAAGEGTVEGAAQVGLQGAAQGAASAVAGTAYGESLAQGALQGAAQGAQQVLRFADGRSAAAGGQEVYLVRRGDFSYAGLSSASLSGGIAGGGGESAANTGNMANTGNSAAGAAGAAGAGGTAGAVLSAVRIKVSQIPPGSQVYVGEKGIYAFIDLWQAEGVQALSTAGGTLVMEMNSAAREGGYYVHPAASQPLWLNSLPAGYSQPFLSGAEIRAVINPRTQTIWRGDGSGVKITGIIASIDAETGTLRLLNEAVPRPVSASALVSYVDTLAAADAANAPFGDGEISSLERLLPGMPVEAVVSPLTGEIMYIAVRRELAIGWLAAVDAAQNRIEISADRQRSYTLFEGAAVTRDGRVCSLAELAPGDCAEALLLPQSDIVLRLTAYSRTDIGQILFISERSGTLQILNSRNCVKLYEFNDDTSFYRWGLPISSVSLQPGTWVRLTLDPAGEKILRLVAAETEGEISGILAYQENGCIYLKTEKGGVKTASSRGDGGEQAEGSSATASGGDGAESAAAAGANAGKGAAAGTDAGANASTGAGAAAVAGTGAGTGTAAATGAKTDYLGPYYIGPSALITQDGYLISASDLVPGERLTLTLLRTPSPWPAAVVRVIAEPPAEAEPPLLEVKALRHGGGYTLAGFTSGERVYLYRGEGERETLALEGSYFSAFLPARTGGTAPETVRVVALDTASGALSSRRVRLDLVMEGGFSDTAGNWAEKSIASLALEGLLCGFPDGRYYPDRLLTREEAAVLALRLWGWLSGESGGSSENIGSGGSDRNSSLHSGLDSSLSSGLFPVDAADAAVSLAVAESAFSFRDESDISGWARQIIKQAQAWGLVRGYPDGTFRPRQAIMPQEMLQLLSNVLRAWEHCLAAKPEAPGKAGPAFPGQRASRERFAGQERFMPQEFSTAGELCTVQEHPFPQEPLVTGEHCVVQKRSASHDAIQEEETVPRWLRPAVEHLVRRGVIAEKEAAAWLSSFAVSRAQAAALAERVMKLRGQQSQQATTL